MIKKHVNGTTLMKFKSDEIGIYVGGEKGCGALYFFTHDPEVTYLNTNDSIGYARTCDFPVSMAFSDTESIDAVIGSLQTAKKILEGKLTLITGRGELPSVKQAVGR